MGSVEGMISSREAALLGRLAAQVAHGVIIEVGSWRGYSTIALAREARVPVYAIEPHETFEGVMGGVFGPRDRVEFFRNILQAGLAEKVRLVNLSSEIVAPGWRRPVGLLWIDGDHRYESVRRDFDWWEPFLEGPAVLHDSVGRGLGPTRLVGELVEAGFEINQQLDATTVLQRRSSSVARGPSR